MFHNLNNKVYYSDIEYLSYFKKELINYSIKIDDNKIIFLCNIFTTFIFSLADLISIRLKYEKLSINLFVLLSSFIHV